MPFRINNQLIRIVTLKGFVIVDMNRARNKIKWDDKTLEFAERHWATNPNFLRIT